MPGHASRHGVDGKLNFCPLGFQGICQLFDQVLGLGDGHAVTGNDDDLFRLV